VKLIIVKADRLASTNRRPGDGQPPLIDIDEAESNSRHQLTNIMGPALKDSRQSWRFLPQLT
jgi:hypothetical protein